MSRIIPIKICNLTGKELESKNDQLLEMERLIAEKRNYLNQYQKKVVGIHKNNEFLEHVRNDYQKYNNYIVDEKNKEMRALKMLNQYIDDLNKSTQLSKQNMIDAKKEQKKILNEINLIQHNLDEIIENTDN